MTTQKVLLGKTQRDWTRARANTPIREKPEVGGKNEWVTVEKVPRWRK